MNSNKKYMDFLRSGNLRAAKDEVDNKLAHENRADVLKEMANTESMELLFHAFSSIKKSKLGKSDIPYLIDVLENMKKPFIGGEEIAAYNRIRRDISKTIEEISNVKVSENEMQNPERLDSFIAEVKKWSHKS